MPHPDRGEGAEPTKSIGDLDPDALQSTVYRELHALAKAKMVSERDGHTLQPTALVHEAWLRLNGSAAADPNNRAQFFHAAAESMRRDRLGERPVERRHEEDLDPVAHLPVPEVVVGEERELEGSHRTLDRQIDEVHDEASAVEKALERTVSKKAERVTAEDDEAGEEVAADGSGTYEGYAP